MENNGGQLKITSTISQIPILALPFSISVHTPFSFLSTPSFQPVPIFLPFYPSLHPVLFSFPSSCQILLPFILSLCPFILSLFSSPSFCPYSPSFLFLPLSCLLLLPFSPSLYPVSILLPLSPSLHPVPILLPFSPSLHPALFSFLLNSVFTPPPLISNLCTFQSKYKT